MSMLCKVKDNLMKNNLFMMNKKMCEIFCVDDLVGTCESVY